MGTADTSRTSSSRSTRSLPDTERQISGGKVLLHLTMSVDGFVARPDHAMDWMTGASVRPVLERGLVDEIDLHIARVLLGAGVRLFDNPGGVPVRLELLLGDDRSAAVKLRYRPVATR